MPVRNINRTLEREPYAVNASPYHMQPRERPLSHFAGSGKEMKPRRSRTAVAPATGNWIPLLGIEPAGGAVLEHLDEAALFVQVMCGQARFQRSSCAVDDDVIETFIDERLKAGQHVFGSATRHQASEQLG